MISLLKLGYTIKNGKSGKRRQVPLTIEDFGFGYFSTGSQV
jgi:hypothetical protein